MQAAAIPAEPPAFGQILPPGAAGGGQPRQQPLQAVGVERVSPVVVKPPLHHAPLIRQLEPRQRPAGQGRRRPLPRRRREGGRGEIEQLTVLPVLLGQPLRQGGDASRGPGMEVLQHGQHLGPHPIAAEAEIGVARIQPDRHRQVLADACGVLAVKRQERAHQPHAPPSQRSLRPQGGQAAAVAAAGQIQQHGLGPVGGGVGRQHPGAAEGFGPPPQTAIAPQAGLRLRGRGWSRLLHSQRQSRRRRPCRERLGVHRALRSPAMVSVPEDERPAVQRRKIAHQPRERHRILATGDGQQQVGALGQQGGLAQQVAMQPVMVRAPAAAGRSGIGWENHKLSFACPRMTRPSSLPASLREAIEQRRLLKVIAGLTNRDQAAVAKIARAAAAGGADLLDLACEPGLVERIRSMVPGLPLCVSAVDPDLFPAAVAAGATMVEIGNFDAFYAQGLRFEAEEVLRLTQRSRDLLPDVVLSVTVPHGLPLDQQEQLAVALAHAGADWIQTEGGTSARPMGAGVLGLIEKAAPTLAAAHAISRALATAELAVPVLCASGLSAVTVPMALAAGASGVGVGSAVNRLTDEVAMLAVVRGLREATATAVAPFRAPAYGVESLP